MPNIYYLKHTQNYDLQHCFILKFCSTERNITSLILKKKLIKPKIYLQEASCNLLPANKKQCSLASIRYENNSLLKVSKYIQTAWIDEGSQEK